MFHRGKVPLSREYLMALKRAVGFGEGGSPPSASLVEPFTWKWCTW